MNEWIDVWMDGNTLYALIYKIHIPVDVQLQHGPKYMLSIKNDERTIDGVDE